MWTVSLPLRVPISKNREFSLNLNEYRNAHYQVLNKAKRNFDDLTKSLLEGIPRLERCTLEYVFYPRTRQRCDTNNILSVVDKFFSDSLVHHGILKDDNYNVIVGTEFKFGRIDPENPRVDAIIKEKKDMKILTMITLTRDDVSTAVREYLAKNGTTLPESFELEGLDDEMLIRIEQSSIPQIPAEATKKTRKSRLEPKEAMVALKKRTEAQTSEAASCEACNEILTPENSSRLQSGQLIHVGCKADQDGNQEEEQPVSSEADKKMKAPAASIFNKPASKVTIVDEPDPEEKKAEEPSKEERKPSLFAGFKRPKN